MQPEPQNKRSEPRKKKPVRSPPLSDHKSSNVEHELEQDAPDSEEDDYQEQYMVLYTALLRDYGDGLDDLIPGMGGDGSVADFAQFCLGAQITRLELQDEQLIMDLGQLWKVARYPEGREAFQEGKRALALKFHVDRCGARYARK